jgi:hypothetical protein
MTYSTRTGRKISSGAAAKQDWQIGEIVNAYASRRYTERRDIASARALLRYLASHRMATCFATAEEMDLIRAAQAQVDDS